MQIRQWQARTLRMIVKIWPNVLGDDGEKGLYSLQDGIREASAFFEVSEAQISEWMRGQGEIDEFNSGQIANLRHVFYHGPDYKKINQAARDVARYIIKEADTSLVRTSLLDVIYAMLRAEKEITRIQFDNRTYPHRGMDGPSLQDEPIAPTMAYFIGVKHGLLKALDLDETTDTFYFTYFR